MQKPHTVTETERALIVQALRIESLRQRRDSDTCQRGDKALASIFRQRADDCTRLADQIENSDKTVIWAES